MKLPQNIRRPIDALLKTVFPSQCVSCGGVVEESSYASICRDCVPRIQLIADPKCLTCGFPFFGETESRTHCMHCEHLHPEFGQGWSIALFRGPLRELIYSLKYKDGYWTLQDLRCLAERAAGLEGFLSGSVLVPVPLHPRKLRERGYNQSDLIVRLLVDLFPNCSRGDLLRREVDTISQTQFDRKQRIRNLKNAFSLRQNRAIDRPQRYVIVDDVFTTGSTVNACASALRRAGALKVDVLTLGHG